MYKVRMVAAFLLLAAACMQADNREPFSGHKLNKAWLQRIVTGSDSSYSKPYFRRDFVTAWYYVNKKDSTLCQVMRDSSQHVRQVVIEKNGVRTFFSRFYPDGQALVIVSLNTRGQFHGEATRFYPDGTLQSKGRYQDGLYAGSWEYYDEKGKLTRKEEYGTDGQLLNTTAY